MPIPRCVICKKRWATQNVKFFYVPKKSDIRKKWSLICGRQLSNSSRICELHFKTDHLYNIKEHDYRSKQLTKEAIPTLYITDDELRNLPEAKSPSPSPLMFDEEENEVDEEDAFQLINEEVFDITSNIVPAPFEEESKEIKFETGTHNKNTQTGFPDSRICATIDVSRDYMIYNLCCMSCTEVFPLRKWSDFIIHMKDRHRLKDNEFFDNCSYKDSEVCIKNEDLDYEAPEAGENCVECVADEILEECHLSCDDIDYSDNEKSEEEDDNDSMCDYWNVSNTQSKGIQEIFIESTESSLVLSLIELLRSHPILWQIPEKNIEVYDASALELRLKFNKQNQLAISTMGIHNSIVRIREWYQKVLGEDSSSKLRPPQNEYYRKCSEFLPALVVEKTRLTSQYGRRTCEICFANVKDGHDLRMHMIIRHKIVDYPAEEEEKMIESDNIECEICGEQFNKKRAYLVHQATHKLPKFQCNICHRTFGKKMQYAEHMKVHYNRRDHVCELCGKAFVRRSNFEMHMKRHYGIKIECKICNRLFSDFTQLGNHRKGYHMVLEGTIEELAQPKRRRRPKIYSSVTDPITKQQRYDCQLCGKNYAYLGGLRKHEIVNHGLTTPRTRRRKKISDSCSQSKEEENCSNDNNIKMESVEAMLDPEEHLENEIFEFRHL